MKNIKILFLLLVCTICLSAQSLDVKVLPVWDGTTEEIIAVNDTFKITNPRQLAWLSEQYFIPNQTPYLKNKTIFIMNDMDLGGESTPPQSWMPIGMGNTGGDGFNTIAFNGHFDGNNKKIINVYIDSVKPYYSKYRPIGFIGSAIGLEYNSITIKNVILENINYNIPKDVNVGGIVGFHEANSTTIENCHVSGKIRSHNGLCGGIVGMLYPHYSSFDPDIKNCSSHCVFYREIQDSFDLDWDKVYAIAGGRITEEGMIESCYATYQSFTPHFYGLGTKVKNCYSTNGFVNQGNGFGDTAYNSYVAATQVINEIMDSNQYSVNCYYDSITYGSQSGRIVKGRGLDTAFMKTAAFVDSLNQGLSEKKWKQDYADCPINNGFPILVWQKKKQTILWDSTTDTLYVGDYYTPTATSTSGLPVSYYVYDFFHWNTYPDKFFVTKAGEAILIAKQAGDSIYAQAPWVYKKFHFLERTYPRRDIKIEEIISPVADSCYAEGSTIIPKVKILNASSVNATNIVVHVIVDSAGTIIRSLAETITVIDTNASYTFEFPFGFTIPTMPSTNNKLKMTMYINALNNDTNLHNDTLSVYFSVKQVNINENKIQAFELGQNQPNPANTLITIPYILPQQGNVLFKIMSISGKVLYKENIQAFRGNHIIDINTSSLSNGMYYYSMEYQGKTIMRKMIIHK
ncbi:MAG TPA: hypothetical protein DCL86_01470 [Bacteroidales bacterium]|nr:hypothetical protein [Bacteroidales bacterium]